jgi:hypothetical protein
MLHKPKVFISHSAKEPEAKALCHAIARAIDPAQFDLLWDQNLQTSEQWRSVIDEWIWRCDSAILVLSLAATDSRYVAYEAALLRQRWKNMAGQFLLVPVWCPGVGQSVLVDRMGALQLQEIQTDVKLEKWPTGVLNSEAAFEDTIDRIQAHLATLLTHLKARHDVEDLLYKQLFFGAATEEALREVANVYRLPPVPNGAKKDLATALARRLLDSDLPVGAERFNALAGGIATMLAAMSDGADRVPRIVNLVAPFCWVSPTGAVRLTALSALPAGQHRAIAWKRSWLLAERMFLYRGYCTRSKDKLKIATASDGAGGDRAAILAHIHSVLAREVCHDHTAPEKYLTSRIQALVSKGVPIFLILPSAAIDNSILVEVTLKWPEVCVFLFGEDLDADACARQFPGVEFVDSEAGCQNEFDAKTGWCECMDLAGVEYEALASGAAFLT